MIATFQEVRSDASDGSVEHVFALCFRSFTIGYHFWQSAVCGLVRAAYIIELFQKGNHENVNIPASRKYSVPAVRLDESLLCSQCHKNGGPQHLFPCEPVLS